MKCNMKTIMKIGAGIIVLLAVAYAALPQVRPMIAGAFPLLLVLVCPLSMLLMMKGMHSDRQPASATPQTPRTSLPGEANAE